MAHFQSYLPLLIFLVASVTVWEAINVVDSSFNAPVVRREKRVPAARKLASVMASPREQNLTSAMDWLREREELYEERRRRIRKVCEKYDDER